ncbi:hypothetical protein Krac_11048 [Ktedonobacter racemifer DSM 44963]|uniref:Uncharacterized protein n=1 Tax=Ktedonobacter racemifer DSM 44963 TaxID=485913 RepID=D6TJ81_KTERA|nr:hypothetical protein Krac_11048 [Ktedonobacter racemifer DSM 44963]
MRRVFRGLQPLLAAPSLPGEIELTFYLCYTLHEPYADIHVFSLDPNIVTRKSLTLLCRQRGPRKREVGTAPGPPNAQKNHPFLAQGMEPWSRRASRSRAPGRGEETPEVTSASLGIAHPLRTSPNRSHATSTQRVAYVGVPQAAARFENRRRRVTNQVFLFSLLAWFGGFFFSSLVVSDPTGEPGGLSEAAPCGLGQDPMLTSPLGASTKEPLSGGAHVRTIR